MPLIVTFEPALNVIPDILPDKSLYICVIVLCITPLVNKLFEPSLGNVSVLILIAPEDKLSPLPELTFTTPKPLLDAMEIVNFPSSLTDNPVPVETMTPPMVDSVAGLSLKMASLFMMCKPVSFPSPSPNFIPPTVLVEAVDMDKSLAFIQS